VLGEIEKKGGSIAPFEEYVEFIEDMIDEVANVLLPPIMNNAQEYGMREKDLLHYRIQIAVLQGKSPKKYCVQAETTSSDYVAQALGWCGYEAEKRGKKKEASAYYEKAKRSLTDIEIPSYAVRKLRKIKKGH